MRLKISPSIKISNRNRSQYVPWKKKPIDYDVADRLYRLQNGLALTGDIKELELDDAAAVARVLGKPDPRIPVEPIPEAPKPTKAQERRAAAKAAERDRRFGRG
jgi:hypothetical protein